MQYKHGSAAVESELADEDQFRDAEMALTMAEMRADVDTSSGRPSAPECLLPPRAAR